MKKAFKEICNHNLEQLSELLENFVDTSPLPLSETLTLITSETNPFSYTLLQQAINMNSFTMTEYLIKFMLNKYYYGVLRKSSGDPSMKDLAK